MRSIKFRAWNKKEKRMANVRFLDLSFDNPELDYLYVEVEKSDKWLYRDTELMQYIGLKDAKNREIYEGDIVKDIIEGFTEEVKWVDGEYLAGYEPWAVGLVYAGRPPFINPQEEVEVIGNKYENPELLK